MRAIIQILKHFGWTWAGLLVSDDDYGLHVARSLHSEMAQTRGGCLAYTEVLPWGENPEELIRIVDGMKKSTARVVIVFAHQIHMIQLMEEASINLLDQSIYYLYLLSASINIYYSNSHLKL